VGAGDVEAAVETDETPEASAVFSPEGSQLFLRADAALKRFDDGEGVNEDGDGDGSPEDGSAEGPAGESPAVDEEAEDGSGDSDSVEGESSESELSEDAAPEDDVLEDAALEDGPAGDGPVNDGPASGGSANDGPASEGSLRDDATEGSATDAPADDDSVKAQDDATNGSSPDDDGSPKDDGPKGESSRKRGPVKTKAASAARKAAAGTTETAPVAAEADARGGTEAAAQEDEAQGQPVAADGHEHAAATTPTRPAQQPSGHFVAPTAVAVVSPTPVRRPAVEGGFDFFGTKAEPSLETIEAVQNEDLADVVGEEALAVHKAEAEAEFKPADEEARGVGQVIDLTAHDETEQIDVQGLRSAVS
jgi:hypothetical protein